MFQLESGLRDLVFALCNLSLMATNWRLLSFTYPAIREVLGQSGFDHRSDGLVGIISSLVNRYQGGLRRLQQALATFSSSRTMVKTDVCMS